MTRPRTYLDWNASAPLRPEARSAMLRALDVAGNASSVHAEGRAARELVEAARTQVAALVGAEPGEVVFTSGATEANAAIRAARPWAGHVCSSMEHPSALASGLPGSQGCRMLAATAEGGSSFADLMAAMAGPSGEVAAGLHLGAPWLVSHQLANGETGVIHDVARLAELVRALRPDAVVHTDAAQAAGRIPVDFQGLGVDAMTLSSHKLGGPQGVGALIVRDRVGLVPLLTGGGQERGRRAGTENVAAIAGFGAAAEAARRNLASEARHMTALRERLEAGILAATPEAVIVGGRAPRLPNTTCMALAGRTAEILVIALDLAGIAVSAGAACSSGKVATSPVLAAMGLDPALRQSAIRVSLGWSTTEADIAAFLAAWSSIAGAAARAA